MKIINETRYSTRTLRSIFTETYRRLAKTEGPHRAWSRYTFRVTYTRTKATSGCAWISGSSAIIRLARNRVRVHLVASLVDHELLHSYGHRHGAIGARWHFGKANEDSHLWATERFGLAIEEKQKPKPAKTDLQEHRYKLTISGVARWEKKLKTAQTRLKNLRQKARYYERALAARRGVE